MTVVYLSGKMTGLEKSEYEKRFNRAEDFLYIFRIYCYKSL